jgi:hypothetical protein
MKPSFFTDEDVFSAVAPALRAAGSDAVSTTEANRLGETDESQLEWAATNGRVLVTFNVSDFARLHAEWLASGRHHAGIVVSEQRPVGDTIRRILRLAAAVDAASFQDRLEYLSSW